MPHNEMNPFPRIFPRIAVLGTGAMGGAIIRGLVNADVTLSDGISISGHWSRQMQEFADLPGIDAFDAKLDPDANNKAVQGAGIIILALKPHLTAHVLREVSGSVAEGTIVISVAAGITTTTIEAHLPASVSVVRVMPNMPALVGKGVTGICAGTRSTGEDMAIAEALFQTVGSVLTVPESQLDQLTSISGSGPAYVFYLIEQLTTVAEHLGFTPEQASALVNGTFIGACGLLAASEKSPQELRQLVTSPKGTTAAAVSVLENGNVRELFERAAGAAVRRAKDLAG
ncbi:pyrroline-5-carboxylate reductase [Paenarthrobacter sp. NPDC058040]|uniref:pyrroline-5-carboxylate reductase n=1 Tax=unclassified Paenarthrobacter TaxID=2634190 RepID=UPI0036DDC849